MAVMYERALGTNAQDAATLRLITLDPPYTVSSRGGDKKHYPTICYLAQRNAMGFPSNKTIVTSGLQHRHVRGRMCFLYAVLKPEGLFRWALEEHPMELTRGIQVAASCTWIPRTSLSGAQRKRLFRSTRHNGTKGLSQRTIFQALVRSSTFATAFQTRQCYSHLVRNLSRSRFCYDLAPRRPVALSPPRKLWSARIADRRLRGCSLRYWRALCRFPGGAELLM